MTFLKNIYLSKRSQITANLYFTPSLLQAESIDSAAEKAAAWAPRSPDELTLELQLACVHPRVCSLAASAGIGVPDPEDSVTTLLHRKDRLVLRSDDVLIFILVRL